MYTEDRKLPKYETPEVITYTDDEILEELGPARAWGYHHRGRRRRRWPWWPPGEDW